VPEDIELSGDKETFTVKVTYDTQVLYGTVSDTRSIVITKG
jgi:hypothetical protein